MEPESAPGKATVLLVEDSPTQARAAETALVHNGYRVVVATSGTAAIKAVKGGGIDVVVLDLILPDLSGKEVCRWLKLNSDTRGIPIIMVTVKGEVEDRVAGLEAGADDYLAKPFSEIELNARIYAALRNKALRDELHDKNRQMGDLLARVEYLAVTDPLTGLFNRRRVESVLEVEWKAVKRYGRELSCFVLDVDHFKTINDEHGHRVGDVVLKTIADIVRSCVREVDTVARWGGEEFLAILPQTGLEGAGVVAERVLERIRGRRFEELPGRQVTASAGVAAAGGGHDNPDKLVNAADFALLQAKAGGRDRVELAAPGP